MDVLRKLSKPSAVPLDLNITVGILGISKNGFFGENDALLVRYLNEEWLDEYSLESF